MFERKIVGNQAADDHRSGAIEGGQRRGKEGGAGQTGRLSYIPAFLRCATSRKTLRRGDGARTSSSQERKGFHDLRSRFEPERQGCQESGGRSVEER